MYSNADRCVMDDAIARRSSLNAASVRAKCCFRGVRIGKIRVPCRYNATVPVLDPLQRVFMLLQDSFSWCKFVDTGYHSYQRWLCRLEYTGFSQYCNDWGIRKKTFFSE